jgi:hypothetical protein
LIGTFFLVFAVGASVLSGAALAPVAVGAMLMAMIYAGHLSNRVSEPVLHRAFKYWRNVDEELGDRIEQAVRAART